MTWVLSTVISLLLRTLKRQVVGRVGLRLLPKRVLPA